MSTNYYCVFFKCGRQQREYVFVYGRSLINRFSLQQTDAAKTKQDHYNVYPYEMYTMLENVLSLLK